MQFCIDQKGWISWDARKLKRAVKSAAAYCSGWGYFTVSEMILPHLFCLWLLHLRDTELADCQEGALKALIC